MSKPIPAIARFMTPAPHSIGDDQPLAEAHHMMKLHSIRHLPVLRGGKLVGILTDRDLAVIESLAGVEPRVTQVEEAMNANVYAVHPEAPLDEVVDEMARFKYGSAIVMQNQKVVGIFTTVDACRALHDLLHSRLK